MSAAWRKRKSVIGRPPRAAIQVSLWLVMSRHLAAYCRLPQLRGTGVTVGRTRSVIGRVILTADRTNRPVEPLVVHRFPVFTDVLLATVPLPNPRVQISHAGLRWCRKPKLFLLPGGTQLSAPSAGLVTPNRRRSMTPRRSCRAARPQTPSRSRVCRRPAARGST